MKSLLNPVYSKEAIDRINRLSPSSTPLWGKMRVDQMLAHLNAFLNTALGEVKRERVLLSYVFGWIAKKKILSDKPFGKDLPTDKNFIAKGDYDFNDEKEHLIALIEHYTTTKGKDVNKYPHPFFGQLTGMEWDRLITKHLDHHLRQFGV